MIQEKDEQVLDEAYRKMFIALQKGGYSAIAEAAYDVMKLPVIIVNAELKKLAQYPEKLLGDPIWDNYITEHEMTPQMTWQLLEDSVINDSEKSETPVWINRSLVEQVPRLVGNFKVDGAIKGYVGVLFPNKEYTDLHVKITQLVCQTAAIEMQKINPTRTTRNALIMAFIGDLFKGKIKNPNDYYRWTESLKMTLKSRFCVVATAGDREKTTLHYVKNVVDETEPNMYAVVLGDRLYTLVTKLENNITPKKLIDSREKQINYLLSMYRLKSGVSEIFDDIFQIANYKYQAEQALNIGRTYSPNKEIYFYNDFVLENIMTCVRDNIDQANYIHPIINFLRQYDEKNGTEYLKTLKVYITSMCRHSVTLSKLHIHRNTLLYRLKKIEELTGTSLDDERFCALLLCNFYLLNDPS